MHFRSKSIVDSVTERIDAIAESVQNDTPLPPPRGAASINLTRQADGGLLVTKTFENGETELLTINSEVQSPAGFTDVTPQAEAPPASAGVDPGGIVQSAALGGDSLDALIKS